MHDIIACISFKAKLDICASSVNHWLIYTFHFSNVLRRLLAMPLVEARVIFLSTNVSNFEFLLVAFHTLAYVFHSIGHVAQ